MTEVELSVEAKGAGVTVRTLRAKNLASGDVQGVKLNAKGVGSFQATVGESYLLSRYVIGPPGAKYQLALAVKSPSPPPEYAIKVRKDGGWDGDNPLEASVWPGGFGLHNSALRMEVE